MKKILLSFLLVSLLFFYPSHVHASNYTFFVEYTDGDSRQVLSITVNSFSDPVYIGYNVSNNTARLCIFSDSVVNFNFSRVTYDSSGSITGNEHWDNRTTVRGDNITGGITCTSILSTNVPLFDNYVPPYFDAESPILPAINSDGSVTDFSPKFDPYNNDYSDDIPAPEVYRDGDKIMFSNSSPDMLLLANIRWYSVDDITLFKESLSWKYRPDSIIHSDLDWLLTVEDQYSSVNGVDLYSLGAQSFKEFLLTYPVDSRTYLGGSNAIGNYLFGYNDALSTLKMILGQIDSSFNAPELFFRYYVPLADGTYKCGKWTKYSRSLPSGASDGAIDGKWNVQYQVSDAPLTSDQVVSSKPYDTTGMTTYTSKDNTVVVDFDSPNYTLSIDNLNQITSLFGQFPSFVSTVFSFLPSWILSLIGCTITLLVGLAVYHALRG